MLWIEPAIRHDHHGCGRPLLLVDGLGGSRRLLDPMTSLLATEPEVIAPDLPGFGETRALPGDYRSPRWPMRSRASSPSTISTAPIARGARWVPTSSSSSLAPEGGRHRRPGG
jgi:pimeloyl-ACP methyl ester carboxylesterase